MSRLAWLMAELRLSGTFTTVATLHSDFQGRADAQSLRLRVEGAVVQLHHQQHLIEQQWHREEPVHVTISIVEGNARKTGCIDLQGSIHDLAGTVGVSLHPRVEDAEVVVCCDECHEARDEHCTLVLVSDSCGTEPQVHSGGHHAHQGEGERVVHRLVLHIAHLVHHPH